MNVAKRRAYKKRQPQRPPNRRTNWQAKPPRALTIRDTADVARYSPSSGNYLRMSRVVPTNYIVTLQANQNTQQYVQSWTLADAGGSLDYVNLFDSYKILSVTATWTPHPSTTSISPAMLWVAADYNDSVIPATLEAIKQYDNVRYASVAQKRILTILPRHGLKADGPTADPGFVNSKNGWISTADITVPHYGFKYGIERNDTSTNAIIMGQWTWKINFLLKNKN